MKKTMALLVALMAVLLLTNCNKPPKDHYLGFWKT